jgi:hypothetical protein
VRQPATCFVLGCEEPAEIEIEGVIVVRLCAIHAREQSVEDLKLDPVKITQSQKQAEQT